MKVFVTGGCGYIGYSVVSRLLLDKDVEIVTVYDNLSKRNNQFFFGQQKTDAQRLNFIKGDILDSYKLKKSIAGHNVVVHLAGVVSTPFNEAAVHNFDQVNNWGTSNLVSVIEDTTEVTRLIIVSSISIYGDTRGKTVTIETIPAAKSAYGKSKMNAEGHALRLLSQKEVYIVRSGNVFGYNPCIRLDSVINRMMYMAQFYNSVEIHGDGNQKRAFVHIEEIAELLHLYTKSSIELPQMLNAVTGNYSINYLAEKITALYPDIDTNHLEQHLTMRSITASETEDLPSMLDINKLENHLINFKKSFRF